MFGFGINLYRPINPEWETTSELSDDSSHFDYKARDAFLCELFSIMVAIKFFDDTFCTNSYYARIGGIQTKEINILEMEFLKGVNFSLLVSCTDYHKYHNELCLHAHNGLCPLCCRIWCEIRCRPQPSSISALFRAQ